MVLQPFDKDYSTPADQAWRRGAQADAGVLGPNPRSAQDPQSFKNAFVNKIRFNPDSKNFYTSNVFSQEIADKSQGKIDTAAGTDQPGFVNPGDNQLAKDFISKYSQGVSRGLIEEDRAITKGGLARLASESATAGSSERDPNTANKFPGEGGTQVG